MLIPMRPRAPFLEKDKSHMRSFILWNLKYDTNEPIYKTETDSDVEIRLVVVKGEVGKESEDLGIWGCLM